METTQQIINNFADEYNIKDKKMFNAFIKSICVNFSGQYAYYKCNPKTKMDVPSIVYENASANYNKWI